jgi:hypothetical protein
MLFKQYVQLIDSRKYPFVLPGMGRVQRIWIGAYYGPLHVSTQYCWVDGKGFFDTCTSHLRVVQRHKVTLHATIVRWGSQTNWVPNQKELWSNTWSSLRSAKENAFLWRMLYAIPATQVWRKQGALSNATIDLQCTRCNKNQWEDIAHCIWACKQSQRVWRWAELVLKMASNYNAVKIGFKQVFFTVPLEGDTHLPFHLWQLLLGICCWQIWKSRCLHFVEQNQTSHEQIIQKSWKRLRIDLCIE